MYYKLGQACVTNWSSFVLQIRETLHYYKLVQVLLQIGTAITN